LFQLDFNEIIIRVIAFLIAIAVHEGAHAYTAHWLGDPTPEREGRLTLNPLKHVDPIGFLMILFGPFGWARPVTTNPAMFKGNRRIGILLVAAMGPIANFLLAAVVAVLYKSFAGMMFTNAHTAAILSSLFTTMIMINVALFVFNLMPLYPLDGEKIIRSLVPLRHLGFFYKMETYGPFILLLIVFIPVLGRTILWPPILGLMRLFLY
jgi:Zn-dependent protease